MYFEYVSVSEKKYNAQKEIERLRKKGISVNPVVVNSKICSSFWGKSWIDKFSDYSDFYNRLARGKSYVKNGFVIDLNINVGEVTGLVIGSVKKPYTLSVTISKMKDDKIKKIVEMCQNSLNSLSELINGKFPKELGEEFLKSDLFPTPKEIKFKCSCPDRAYMCKHVAAILYGIGARFDAEALMFFKLRGINVDELIKKTADQKTDDLLKKASKKSKRAIEDDESTDLFKDILN